MKENLIIVLTSLTLATCSLSYRNIAGNVSKNIEQIFNKVSEISVGIFNEEETQNEIKELKELLDERTQELNEIKKEGENVIKEQLEKNN